MTDFPGRVRLEWLLNVLEPWIEGILFLLSLTAIALVGIHEFVAKPDFTVPWLDVDWESFRTLVQTITWSAFVLDVALYGLVSRRPIRYARVHWVELIICVTWMPFHADVLLQQVQTVLSLQTLVLIGAVAHVIRIARWIANRFSEHPFVVLSAALVVLVSAGSVALMQVEPSTFKTFGDTAYFVIMTMFTVGSDINPHTLAGRAVTCVVAISSIASGMVFLTMLSRTIGKRLTPGQDTNDRLLQQLSRNGDLMEQLVAQQKEATDLGRRRLELLEEQVHGKLLGSVSEADVPLPSSTAPSGNAFGEPENRNK